MKAPSPKRAPVHVRHHGREIIDDHAWLKADNWQSALAEPDELPASIIAHLKAEDAYARAVLGASAALRDELVAAAAASEADASPPKPERIIGDWIYAEHDSSDAHSSTIVRQRIGETAWQTVLNLGGDDGDDEDADDPLDIDVWAPSPDHRLLAYLVDAEGDERFTVRIRDVARGVDLPDVLVDVAGDIAWSADGRTLIYTRLDRDHRPLLLMAHTLGAPQAADVVVFAETDPAMEIYLEQPEPGGTIAIEIASHETTEIRLLDAARLTTRLFSPRTDRVHVRVLPSRTALLVLRHRPGAEDGEILLAPAEAATIDDARAVLRAETDCVIEDCMIAADRLVRLERQRGTLTVVASLLDGTGSHAVVTADPGAMLSLLDTVAADVFVVCSSPMRPEELVAVDAVGGTRRLIWRAQADGAHRDTDFVISQIMAPASDGTQIPITLFHHRATPPGPSRPLWLEVYGAYGDAVDLEWSAERSAAAAHGMVFAVAHVRGGGEFGNAWAEGGRYRLKQNSIDDYLACARHLIATGHASAGGIIAATESAGGIVVGAALNVAPGLFLMGYARVPFVDVLNTMLDAAMPLTPGEWPEWGNPITSADDFDLISSYSPYDNVAEKPYPPVIATAGVSDQRVGYWEPAKWIVRLRERSTSGAAMVLDLDWSAGHSGDGEDREAAAYAHALHLFARAGGS